jgi:hypothetical protein
MLLNVILSEDEEEDSHSEEERKNSQRVVRSVAASCESEREDKPESLRNSKEQIDEDDEDEMPENVDERKQLFPKVFSFGDA